MSNKFKISIWAIAILGILFLGFGCGNAQKNNVADYFNCYGNTTFFVHKPLGVDTFTWEGSYMVIGHAIYSRRLSADSTRVSVHQSVRFDYPVTLSLTKISK